MILSTGKRCGKPPKKKTYRRPRPAPRPIGIHPSQTPMGRLHRKCSQCDAPAGQVCVLPGGGFYWKLHADR